MNRVNSPIIITSGPASDFVSHHWGEFIVPAVIILGRYVWKGILWLILPGIQRAVAAGIRTAIKPDLEDIKHRLIAVETRLDALETAVSTTVNDPKLIIKLPGKRSDGES
jgi:hypothetical protein